MINGQQKLNKNSKATVSYKLAIYHVFGIGSPEEPETSAPTAPPKETKSD